MAIPSSDIILEFKQNFVEVFRLKVLKALKGTTAGTIFLLESADNTKILMKTFSRDGGDHFRSRFLKEASVLNEMDHRHIIKLYLAAACPEYFCLCVPYYPGGDLLARRGQLTRCDALRYFSHVTDVLQYLHGRSIIHGDVTMENIVINNDNEAVLVGFGSTLCLRDNNKVMNWRGSGGLVPPETRHGRAMCGYKLEIWNLGILLWRLVTSRNLYLSIPKVAADQIAAGKFNVIEKPYRHILQRLLDVEPSKRATADEARQLLSTLPVLCLTSQCSHSFTFSRPV